MTVYQLTGTPQQVATGSTVQSFTNTGGNVATLTWGSGQSTLLYPGAGVDPRSTARFAPGGAVMASSSGGTSLAVVDVTTDQGTPGAGGIALDDLGPDVLAWLLGTYVKLAGPAPARQRDFPMRPPVVLSSPPATAAGASSSSVVAGSVLVSGFEPQAFRFLGGFADVKDITAPSPSGVNLGEWPPTGNTSPSPVTAEFWLDSVDATGRFEVYWSGPASNSGMRVAIQQSDGSWGYVSAAATFSHSNSRADLVTLGAAGLYRIRLEFAGGSVFFGVYVGASDTVTATHKRKRYMVIGDSFTEPTIDDSGSFVLADGWVQQLAYLTGYDMWSAGRGGTGYLQPSTRVKFRDRLAADILAYSPDGIIWAGGINDYGNFSAAAIGAEALACYQQAQAAGVSEQVVLSPFWPSTLTDKIAANLIATSDAIKASATSLALPFLNLLEMPDTTGRFADWTGSTLQSSVSIGGTSLSVASIPAYMQVAYVTKSGLYVRVDSGTNIEIRRVTNITGSGPYTLAVSALSAAHAAGTPVVLSGPQYMTGSGKQGATTGSGNSDRYTGNGGTHPTKAGHAHIARVVANMWARALAG